jgi:4-amino-4-deoxy-L-arabinose transferase-like glycosyltransferase
VSLPAIGRSAANHRGYHTGVVKWRVLILAAGAALLLIYSRLITFIPDGITYGAIEAARNLAEGRGLVTQAGPAAFVPYYRDLTPPFPYLWYPLVPIVTSALFSIFGVHQRLIVVFPTVMYLLSGIAVFELGRRLFNPVTGVLAALTVLVQPFMLETAARENFTDPVLVGLLVSAVLVVFVASADETRRPLRWLAAGGVLFGLCQYARSAATALYVPMLFLVALAAPRRRARWAGVFLLACLVTQVPLFVWNMRHIGRLTFTPGYLFVSQTPSFPAQSAIVSVLPRDFPIFSQHAGEVLVKWISQLWVHYKYFFTMTSPLLMVGAMLFGARRVPERQRVLWIFTVALYLTIATLNSLYIWDNRYLLPVVPFVAILGVEFIRETLAAAPFPASVRMCAAALIALLVLADPADFVYQLVKSRAQFPLIRRDAMERKAFMKAHLRPSDVVMAVDAPLIAWETRNVALGLPLSPMKATFLHDRYVRFNTLVLETRRPRSDLYGFAEDWFQIARGEKTYRDFRIEASDVLSTGQRLVLLRSGSNESTSR